MSLEFFVYALLVGVLALATAQDVRTREVSNWISVPLFFAGLLGVIAREEPVITGFFILAVVLGVIRGGYGPADGKILAGLVGLWPQAALLAAVLIPFFDLVWRKRSDSPAPLVAPMAIAALLTFGAYGGNILLVKRLIP
jgi:Flp pilus assembly protein protease CpaA